MKRLIGVGLGAALFLATVAPTFAANCRIVNTGRGSRNICTVTVTKTADTRITNSGSVQTIVNSTVSTGGNTANGNTGGATIKTGNATSDINITTVMNQTTVKVVQ